MRIATLLVLSLSGLSYLAFGLALTVAPIEVLTRIDVQVTGAIADTEIRAFYGGLELALGALILACAFAPARRRDGLLLTALSYGGIGLTRIGSMLVTGDDSSFLRFAAGTEIGFLLIAGLLWWQSRTHTPS